jgi:uncharacterized protein (DUF433 family)
MEKATIPLIAFTSDTVSRLTGLTVRQLHHWDRTRFFVPSFADPYRRRPHRRVYSFVDLVGLRTIADLRARGVSWPDLKRVRSYFREHGRASNTDWTERRFFVVGRNVYFTHDEAVSAARPLGQSAHPTILDLGPIVKDLERAVRELPVRTKDEIGRITSDRLIMDGKDIIAGTRIPTATIDWFYRHGYSLEEIREDFPRLTEADVEAAIAHEAKKRQASLEPVDVVA